MTATFDVKGPARHDIAEGVAGRRMVKTAILISLSLVLAATALMMGRENILPAFAMHRPISMLEHAGGVQLSAANLKGHVPLPMHAGHTSYWLGPIAGFTYTTNCATPGVLKVGYFESGQLVSTLSEAKILISAFASEDVYKTHPRPLRIDPEIQIVNARGDLLSYRESDMTTFTIRQNHSSEVISVAYSNAKNVTTMIKNSEMLTTL